MLRNITVIGTGLIGASAALAARRAGASVHGWDPDPTHVYRHSWHYHTEVVSKEAH